MKKLKPCKCGSRDLLMIPANELVPIHLIMCSKCGQIGRFSETREDAITGWNTQQENLKGVTHD